MQKQNDFKRILEEKVADYKRFAFILLSLTIFLFIGLLVPNGEESQIQSSILIGLNVCSIVFAVIFHKKAMKIQEQLYSEEQ